MVLALLRWAIFADNLVLRPQCNASSVIARPLMPHTTPLHFTRFSTDPKALTFQELAPVSYNQDR